MDVALINSNRMRPPIGPIGLEYVAETLHRDGHRVHVLDLCWPDEWQREVRDFFSGRTPGLIGLSLRNTDDCGVVNRQSFLPYIRDLVNELRACSTSPIALGGVGFSVMPETVLGTCGGDIGIRGEGEYTTSLVASALEGKQPLEQIPNLVLHQNGAWINTPTQYMDLKAQPAMTRKWVDNPRYFREGGQAGFETKRGCTGACIYCADPVAKGHIARCRPPAAVAAEVEKLLAMGIDHLHTCDSEFNMPEEHAKDVCREFIRRGLGRKLRWYAYCSPGPFSAELAELMARAGCAGINFGVDNGSERMLKKLRRGFSPQHILDAAQRCHDNGITVMFDLLLGAPEETRESLEETIALMRRSKADRIGVSVGVLIYPGTPLSEWLQKGHGKNGLLEGDNNRHTNAALPNAFVEPAVQPFIYSLLDTLIGDDPRFLFFDPNRPDRNYNYNANQRLIDAIANGCRGAYWDILRQSRP